MNCRENCPKIAEFEAAKQSLYFNLAELDIAEAKTSQATQLNRSSRRSLNRLNKNQPESHQAMRSLSDAEFYQSEAYRQINDARAQIAEALELQDNAIETCIAACPSQTPIAEQGPTETTLKCSLDF